MHSRSLMMNRFALNKAINGQRSLNTVQQARRNFGAMDQVNKDLFVHEFTDKMEFRSSFEKIKCFRVMDEEGNIINKGYDEQIDTKMLLAMYDKMITMNEADVVYNAAQRQSRISFYMT